MMMMMMMMMAVIVTCELSVMISLLGLGAGLLGLKYRHQTFVHWLGITNNYTVYQLLINYRPMGARSA